MAHKTIKISQKAYESLKSLEKENESFTDVILRITIKNKANNDLFAWLRSKTPSDELSDSIDTAYKKRNLS